MSFFSRVVALAPLRLYLAWVPALAFCIALPAFSQIETEEIPGPSSSMVDRAQIHLPETGRIPGLKWKSEFPKAKRLNSEGETPEFLVKLLGSYPKEEWTLMKDGKKIKTQGGKGGQFTIPVTLQEKTTKIEFVAVGPRGQIHREEMTIDLPGWKKLTEKPKPLDPTDKKHYFSPGLGITLVTLTDVRTAEAKTYELTEWATTGKLAYTYKLIEPDIDLGVSTYFTIQPFAASLTEVAYFLGVNARLGYNTRWLKDPWRFSIQGGIYYLTMFVEGKSYGYENLGGPQIYPSFRYQTAVRQFIQSYLKFSAVNQNFGFQFTSPFSNREIAVGTQYSFIGMDGDIISLTLDYSNLELSLTDDNGVVVPQSTNTMTIGASYTF